ASTAILAQRLLASRAAIDEIVTAIERGDRDVRSMVDSVGRRFPAVRARVRDQLRARQRQRAADIASLMSADLVEPDGSSSSSHAVAPGTLPDEEVVHADGELVAEV